MNIYLNEESFYNDVKRNKNKDAIFHFKYNGIDMNDDKYLKKYPEKFFELITLHALNIKNIKERYEFR